MEVGGVGGVYVEGVGGSLAALVSLRRESERRSQRWGWDCCDSCELSQCLCVSQQPPEGDGRHSPHRRAKTRNGGPLN